jgi:fructose-1-phosphate kinase PfkB-like protein
LFLCLYLGILIISELERKNYARNLKKGKMITLYLCSQFITGSRFLKREPYMDLQAKISAILGTSHLTADSLKQAIAGHQKLPDKQKRRINRAIALQVIGALRSRKARKIPGPQTNRILSGTKVLGVNHAGPLDVTLDWKIKDGALRLSQYHIDAGGDQVNVSKVFSDFHEKIALVTLAGKKGGKITSAWERNFLDKKIAAELIRSGADVPVQVYNMLGGEQLPGMHGWQDRLSKETVDKINARALKMLGKMVKGKPGDLWMLVSAGGPIRYNPKLACYAALVKEVKKKYGGLVKFLIDFKFMSGPDEAMSVLGIERTSPQDIIKPNLEEFIQVLSSSGLIRPKTLDIRTITNDEIKKYASELRKKYNLLGVLVSMDKSGLLLALKDRIIREKGIKIIPACQTASGDSLKAGFVYSLSRGRSFEEAVHTGNLFGAATASMQGSRTVNPRTLNRTMILALEQGVSPEVENI